MANILTFSFADTGTVMVNGTEVTSPFTLTENATITITTTNGDQMERNVNGSNMTGTEMTCEGIDITYSEGLHYPGNWTGTIYYRAPLTPHELTYNTNGATAIPSVTVTNLPDPLPTPTLAGWAFGGWYDEPEFVNEALAGSVLLEDKTIYAKFSKKEWKKILDEDSGGGEVPQTYQEITHSDLVGLKNAGNLVPGTWYRITDYEYVPADTATQVSGNHPFDILTMAVTTSQLGEQNCYAIQRAGDTYFDVCDLERWKIWYKTENDTEYFTGENGKGSVTRMIDEHNNDLRYDFKNIKWKRTIYEGEVELYTFNCSLASPEFGDSTVMENPASASNNNTLGRGCAGNVFSYNCNHNILGDNCSNNMARRNWEFNTLGNRCSGNTFEHECNYISFGDNCSDNEIGFECTEVTFGNHCKENSLREWAYRTVFADRCSNNSFNYGCSDNIFGPGSSDNSFEANCVGNTFGNDCKNNTLGERDSFNIFGNGCEYNLFYSSLGYNILGDLCKHNAFYTTTEIQGMPIGSGKVRLGDNTEGFTTSENNILLGVDINPVPLLRSPSTPPAEPVFNVGFPELTQHQLQFLMSNTIPRATITQLSTTNLTCTYLDENGIQKGWKTTDNGTTWTALEPTLSVTTKTQAEWDAMTEEEQATSGLVVVV